MKAIKSENQERKVMTQVHKQAHLGPGIIQSMKKYENIKLQKFMEVLFEKEVSAEKFAEEMERFFMYHSLRK
jgi:hypothetical protein